jgi:flagellar biosynthesis/type III secretory pathway protein FliH
MKKIELEDFSHIVEILGREEKEEKAEEERRLEEEKKLKEKLQKLKAEYTSKIVSLQREFLKKIEEEKEKSFKEGFKKGFEKGFEDGKKKTEDDYRRRIQELKEEHEAYVKSIRLNLEKLEKDFRKKWMEFSEEAKRILLDSIMEVLEFLYIDPKNAEFVSKKIEEIIGEFSEEVLTIELGEELFKFVDYKNKKKNPELGVNDFRINFDMFSIESRIKEKIQLIREEVERAVKKSSKV